MANLNHIMVDIETVDNTVTSAMLSIAAVPWNPSNGSYARKNFFYEVINLDSCFQKGLTAGGETIAWWFKQSKDARLMALGLGENHESIKDPLNLTSALIKFELFLKSIEALTGEKPKLWGNSARFDLGIIANAYKACKLPIPWSFRNERDVRTLVQLNPLIKSRTKFHGTRHNPVNDCVYQIKYCSKIWRKLNVGKKETTKKAASAKTSSRKKV